MKIYLFFFLLFLSESLLSTNIQIGAIVPFFYSKGISYCILRPISKPVTNFSKVEKEISLCESFNESASLDDKQSRWELACKAFAAATNNGISSLDKQNISSEIIYEKMHYTLFFEEITNINDIHFLQSLYELQYKLFIIIPTEKVIQGLRHIKKKYDSFCRKPFEGEDILDVPTLEEFTTNSLEEFRLNLNDPRYPILLNEFFISRDDNIEKIVNDTLEKIVQQQTDPIKKNFNFPELHSKPFSFLEIPSEPFSGDYLSFSENVKSSKAEDRDSTSELKRTQSQKNFKANALKRQPLRLSSSLTDNADSKELPQKSKPLTPQTKSTSHETLINLESIKQALIGEKSLRSPQFSKTKKGYETKKINIKFLPIELLGASATEPSFLEEPEEE